MEMKKITCRVMALLLVGFSTLSYATGAGPYLGLQVGQTNTHNVTRNVQTGGTPSTESVTPSNTGFGGRIFAGYSINPYMGLEGGFTHYGPSDYKPTVSASCGNPQIRENAFDFVGKGTLPLGKFGVFAKAGVAVVRTSMSGSLDTDTTLSGCDSSNTTNYVRPTAAVGVSYDLTPSWVADLSYSTVFKGGGVQAADFLALGLSYHFVDAYCGQFLC
jgi:OOP family OmpA-OmpF porin